MYKSLRMHAQKLRMRAQKRNVHVQEPSHTYQARTHNAAQGERMFGLREPPARPAAMLPQSTLRISAPIQTQLTFVHQRHTTIFSEGTFHETPLQ
jgi:hypothetical protein